MSTEDLVVAADLGGTLTKIGYATSDGTLTGIERVATELSADRSVDPDWFASVLAARAADPPGGRCVGFGVVVPGVIESRTGVVRAAPNVGWTDLPLRATLTERLRLPAGVGHDVRSAGLAEWRLGRGVGVPNLLFLALGTGIAGALVVDGRLLEADGYAGEVGHLRVPSAGEHRCACGLYGCLETVSSAAGVARSYARLTGTLVEAQLVAERARTGDQAALQSFAVAAAGLVEALAVVVPVVGPELIIIGGGLAGAADLLMPDLGYMLSDRLSFHRMPAIALGSLGPDAGVIGAGLVGWDQVRAEAGDHR